MKNVMALPASPQEPIKEMLATPMRESNPNSDNSPTYVPRWMRNCQKCHLSCLLRQVFAPQLGDMKETAARHWQCDHSKSDTASFFLPPRGYALSGSSGLRWLTLSRLDPPPNIDRVSNSHILGKIEKTK